jgi:hypothetical protein
MCTAHTIKEINALFAQLTNIFFVTAGFALLPFMWFVNGYWFFEEAVLVPPYEEQQEIQKC